MFLLLVSAIQIMLSLCIQAQPQYCSYHCVCHDFHPRLCHQWYRYQTGPVLLGHTAEDLLLGTLSVSSGQQNTLPACHYWFHEHSNWMPHSFPGNCNTKQKAGVRGDTAEGGLRHWKKKAYRNETEKRVEWGSWIRHGGREIRRVTQVCCSMGKGSASKDKEERDCISASSQWTWLHSQVDSSVSCRPSASLIACSISPSP